MGILNFDITITLDDSLQFVTISGLPEGSRNVLLNGQVVEVTADAQGEATINIEPINDIQNVRLEDPINGMIDQRLTFVY